MAIYNKGVVIGKFYPPHNGHLYLIEQGMAQSNHLTVLVCDTPGEAIPASLRASWIREIYADDEDRLTVYTVDNDSLPENDSPLWAALTIRWLGFKPDVAFTSEEYGYPWTEAMGCDHVLVDIDREKFPVSGTMIRANPLEYQHYLHPIVWAYFVKRVVVIGAESTGTTTLTKALAGHYNTLWVPEYGRTYSEQNHVPGDTWVSQEFETIMVEQNRLEDLGAKYANKILFCDTDSFATDVWHEYYFDHRWLPLEEYWINRKYDLYIVTPPDIPFVQDDYGMRELIKTREWMHNRITSRLHLAHKKYFIVAGSVEQRMETAIEKIDNWVLHKDHCTV